MSAGGMSNKDKMKAKTKEGIQAYIFLAPTLLIIALFRYWPTISTMIISFFDYNLISPVRPFVKLRNYIVVFSDPLFYLMLRNTLLYAVGMVSMSMLVALAVAITLDKVKIGVNVFKILYFIPVITSVVAVSLVWQYMYDPKLGLVNWVLNHLGLPSQGWLTDTRQSLFGIILMGSWQQIGFNMLVFLAGLKGISGQYYEAARIDGATSWQQFIKITLPLLKPVILFVLIVQTSFGFQVFTQVYVMTQGGPADASRVIVYHIYQTAFETMRLGRASALSMILFGIILVIALVQLKIIGLRETE